MTDTASPPLDQTAAPPIPRRRPMGDPELLNLPRQEFDTPETEDGEVFGWQFQKDAVENNYWMMFERRRREQADALITGMAAAVYGEPPKWLDYASQKQAIPGYTASQFETERLEGLKRLFADADAMRQTNPGAGELANFPADFAALEEQASTTAKDALRSELSEADLALLNRSDPNFAGGMASFGGSMLAGVSDVEGVATLPWGFGSGSLARTILTESALGATGAALAIPAQQKQAARLGTEAPDPVAQVLAGAAFGGILPIAGRALKMGVNTLTPQGRAENADLIQWGLRPGSTSAERAAARQLAAQDAATGTKPAGTSADSHEATLDAATRGLVDNKPEIVRADDVIPEIAATRSLPPIAEGAPENWEAIRGGIFAGESGGDYDALYSYSNRQGGPFENVKLTEMTVDEAIAFSDPKGTYAQWVKARIGRVATPMGAYQIVGKTLRAAKEGLQLRGDELMDEALQERLGIYIYQQQGTGAWEGYRGPRSNFQPRTAKLRWRDPGADIPADDVMGFDPYDLQTDAAGYQFKMGGDQFGVTGRLTGERVWDSAAAVGVMVHERLDGTRFIADGHQRLGLARRMMQEGVDGITLQGFLYREADGWTVEDVRARAALKNIRQESGTPLDAAKILRDNPELTSQMGSRSRPFMLQAQGLADLAPGPFQAVVNDVVPQNYAALVGRLIPDDDRLQGVAIAALKKTDPANEVQAESVVRDIRRLGLEKKADDDQMDLFGNGFDLKRTVISERMKVTDAVIKAARADRAIFTKLEREADTIQEAGNVLDRTANVTRAEAAERILARFLILANQDGPVRDALDAAARNYRAGTKLDDAVAEVTAVLGRASETDRAGSGADGTDRGGAASATLDPVPEPNLFDLPPMGEGRIEPGLFDDPVTSPAEMARLAANEREVMAILADPENLPDMDMEMDLFGDGATTLSIRDATARLAEETDFVDALKHICMKG